MAFTQRQAQGYLYVIQSGKREIYKIGVSKHHPRNRLQQLQTGSAERLRLVRYWKRRDYKDLEARLHNKFRYANVGGEWFQVQLPIIIESVEGNNTMGRIIAKVWAFLQTATVIAISLVIAYAWIIH